MSLITLSSELQTKIKVLLADDGKKFPHVGGFLILLGFKDGGAFGQLTLFRFILG